MEINYKRPFAQFVKKANKPFQLAIEDRVIEICKNPNLGEQKLGDLQSVFIFKFRFNKQEYLIAYKLSKYDRKMKLTWINFCQIGSHENFYTELKRFLRKEAVLRQSEEEKK